MSRLREKFSTQRWAARLRRRPLGPPFHMTGYPTGGCFPLAAPDACSFVEYGLRGPFFPRHDDPICSECVLNELPAKQSKYHTTNNVLHAHIYAEYGRTGIRLWRICLGNHAFCPPAVFGIISISTSSYTPLTTARCNRFLVEFHEFIAPLLCL